MPQIQEHRDVQEVVRAHAGWVFACAKRRARACRERLWYAGGL